MTESLPREILEVVIKSASDAVIVSDERRHIVFFNAEAERLFGYGAQEVLGEDFHILIPPRFTEGHARQFSEFVGSSIDHQVMSERPVLFGQKKDGSEFPVEITISKVLTPLGLFATAIVRDITHRKFVEQELQRHADELSVANEGLKKLNEIKNQFLGMATHDLRNPLIRIRNGTEMLLNDNLSDEQRRKLLSIIHTGAESMLLLISDLLDVNQIESGRIELHKQEVDCQTYLEEIRESHVLIAQRKNISLVLDVKEGTGSVHFDPKRIHQVMENLLSNAIKFSPNGAVVTITAAIKDKNLIITVKDQGVGIPQGEISKLFGAFQQLSTRATAGEKGTGLGLVIAKRIVELHGGTINVTSKEGSGSEFSVILPI